MSAGDAYRIGLKNDWGISPLQLEDLPAVMEVERGGYSHPWKESVFRDCFRPDYRLWRLSDGEALGGYAVVAYLFDEAHLLNLCVARDYRSVGAGRRLLRHLLRESFGDGMQRLILEVRRSNQVAAGLYRSEGFEQIGERRGYYPGVPEREDALVFALEAPVG
ncbi:ribosomal protein S18-alanine N-acetyltransferase [Marinobacter bohaiensis]|uniref:ribosomal protein S18-alanine N-acetyltransferase n=1 Tax=Marinobacter bohaiensis TaxID=2201898 RepID=UPI000DABB204|nr:ribosomal protein S18-alanine N-acetyltransferase [Marinobacter bohaiensis]